MTRAPRRPPPEGHLIERRELLDAKGIEETLTRLAKSIEASVPRPFALVGIRTGGWILAQRLQKLIHPTPDLGAVDIALYRDDVFEGLPRPEIGPTDLPFSIEGRVIVLVDDVLYTGRTVRAALDALVDYGRPKGVQLAVLIDRGHRELPIQANYTGLTVETTRSESVRVVLEQPERVVLRERAA